LDLAAKRGGDHRTRHAAEKVCAIALEQVMRLYRQEDVEIARRSATHARFALTCKADACAILHASRCVDGERTLFLSSTRAMTIGARLVDGLAAPVAGRAGAFNGEEALRR